jgi:hypothetical protein
MELSTFTVTLLLVMKLFVTGFVFVPPPLPLPLPSPAPVPGVISGRLLLWSLNPFASLSLPTICCPWFAC